MMKGSKRIDELEPAVQINEDDSFIVQQSEATRKITGNQINSHIQMVANKTVNPLLVLSKATGEGVVTINDTANYPLQALVVTGATQRDGIPEPANPVYPASLGDSGAIDIMMCGRNLCPTDPEEYTRGKIYAYIKLPLNTMLSVKLKEGQTNTLPNTVYAGYTGSGGDSSGGVSWAINAGQIKKETVSSGLYNFFSVCPFSAIDEIFKTFDVQIEVGNQTTDHVPYHKGETITIPVDRPLMRIGSVADTIDLLTGDGLQTWNKLEFDGSEALQAGNTQYDGTVSTDRCISRNDVSGNSAVENVMCTHLPWSGVAWTKDVQGICLNTRQIHLRINNDVMGITADDDSAARTAKMRAYLKAQYDAGTPVTVWYQLAQPTTYQVTPVSNLRSYDSATTISVYGASEEPSPEIEAKAVLDATTVVADQQAQIDELREMISNLQSAALTEEIGGTK